MWAVSLNWPHELPKTSASSSSSRKPFQTLTLNDKMTGDTYIGSGYSVAPCHPGASQKSCRDAFVPVIDYQPARAARQR